MSEQDWLRLGGAAMGALKGAEKTAVIVELADQETDGACASLIAMGMKLRAYDFDLYKTKKGKPREEKPAMAATILCQGA